MLGNENENNNTFGGNNLENSETVIENTDAGYTENAQADASADVADSQQAPKYSYATEGYTPEGWQQQDKKSKKKGGGKKRRPILMTVICAVLFGVIAGGLIIGSFVIGKSAASSISVSTTETKLSEASSSSSDSEEDSDSSSSGEYTVSEIASQCMSSVVAITSLSISEVQTMFGTMQEESTGAGSGVIIAQSDTELMIVTNYHVIEGASELTVCFNDSEDSVYSAAVKGYDSSNDLAVIAVALEDISEEDLASISIATIGDSTEMEVGDEVVAIGNALGLGQSVTSGVISALEREVTIDDVTTTLMQTDAAINPGNSGGALFNMKGELIGINSAKYSSEDVEGMGFAIPMSTAQSIIEELMNQETRTQLESDYGYLGISGQDVSDEAQSYYGMPAGVYVASVLEGSAAENAGIQAGDIITSLDGKTIDGISELQDLLTYYAAGEEVEVVIYRSSNGTYEEQTVTVTLDNASEQSTSSSTDSSTSDDSTQTVPTVPDSDSEDSSDSSDSQIPFSQQGQ